MARVRCVGFEIGSNSEAFGIAGTYSIQSTTVRTGNYALRTNPTTTNMGYGRFGGIAANGSPVAVYYIETCYHRFYFRFATKPASDDEEIFVSRTTSAVFKFGLRLNSSGQLVAYDSTNTLLATGATALSSGTWYRIEVMVGTGASASWEVKINGTSEISGTGNLETSNNGESLYGKAYNRNGQSVDYYFDDIAIDDADYPGDGAVLLMTPDGNGTYQTWSIGAGSGSHYQIVDDVPPDNDTSYLLSTGTIGDAETETLASCASIGISGTINGACLILMAAKSSGSNGIKPRLRSGATNSDAGSAGGTSFLYNAVLMQANTDPATGAAWTTSGLDAVEVGAVEAATTNQTKMTFAGLMVEFLAAGGGGTVPTPYYRLLAGMGNL